MQNDEELANIKARYDRRSKLGLDRLYNPISPYNALVKADLHMEIAAALDHWLGPARSLSACVIMEVGCGSGANLLEMISLGADPSRILANELLPERLAQARHRLPSAVTFFPGDLMAADIAPGTVDLALQFTVFSSILDVAFRREIAQRMWSWLRPGGALLSYDFIYDNPNNPDVQKITVAELRSLFPDGEFDIRRVTLAPPLGRRIAPFSVAACRLLKSIPFLRSHTLCLIRRH